MDDDNDVMFNNFRVGLPEAEVDIPEGVATPIGDSGDTVLITGGDANLNPEGVIPAWPNSSVVVAGSYYLELTGTGPWTVVFTTTALWGAYYSDGVWNPVENVAGTITFNIPVSGSKDLGVPIVLGDEDPTLPVELSVFNALLTAQNFVKLTWVSESETSMLGYRVYRNQANELGSATLMTPVMIQATNTSITQSYSLEDYEVSMNNTYYYWLEAADYGHSSFFGPVMVSITAEGEESDIPELPVETKLYSAFPNPFNPSTNLRYSMREAGEVRIDIFNSKGQIVRSFTNRHQEAGYYQVSWDGRDMNGSVVSTGMYLYQMSTDNYSATKKMMMMK